MRTTASISMLVMLGLVPALMGGGCTKDEPAEVDPLPGETPESIHEREEYLRQRSGEPFPLARWRAFEKLPEVPTLDLAWASLGPMNVGGRILAHAFDPENHETLWVGSAGGGLWRTPNGGLTWQLMTDTLPSLSVSSIVINLQNPQSILIGTGQGRGGGAVIAGAGIFKSYDGGSRWDTTAFATQLSESVAGYGLAWDPEDTTIVHYATTIGLFRSTDGGVMDWTRTLRGTATALAMNPRNPSILYTVIQYPDSTEANPDSVGLFRSLNRGQTWQRLASFLEALPSTSLDTLGTTSLAISAADPEVVYVGAARKMNQGNNMLGFYKTPDGGETWEKIVPRNTDGQALDLYCRDAATGTGCQANFDNVVAASPFDPARVFVGGVNLYRSDNGGSNWYAADSTGQLHVDHHDFAFDPADSNIVYSLNDGGVYQSNQRGDPGTWATKNEGLVTLLTNYIASASGDIPEMAAGAQDQGTLLLTPDSSHSAWKPLSQERSLYGGDGLVVLIDPQDADIIYGETQNGYLWRTLDGGSIVQCMTERCGSPILKTYGITQTGIWATPLVMNLKDPGTLYTSTQDSIFKTTDASNPDTVRWKGLFEVNSISQIAIDHVDTALVYAYSEAIGNTLYRSTDAGQTWPATPSSPGCLVSDLEADPDTRGVLYATCSTYNQTRRVLVSRDSGDTWADITWNLPVVPAQAIAITPAAITGVKQIYVGTDLGVFMTSEDPSQPDQWLNVNGNLPNAFVYDMHFHASDRTIRVGTYGRGLWKTTTPNLRDE